MGDREDWDMQECSHQEWRFDSIYEWLHVRETSFQGTAYLCNFTKCPSFLSEIDDHPTSALLCLFHGFFDAENEVWTTRADVRSEHVTSITLLTGLDEDIKGLVKRRLPHHGLSKPVERSHLTFLPGLQSNIPLSHLIFVRPITSTNDIQYIPEIAEQKIALSSMTWNLDELVRTIPIGGRKSLMSPRVINSG